MKSYTDIEQSKKLADILPLESADMWWAWYSSPLSEGHYGDFPMFCKPVCNPDESVPCWSLAALLNVMPKGEGIECSISFGYYDGKGEYIEKWLCAFEKEGESTDDYIIETIDGDNPVDACYEMALRLHEQKLL